MVGSTRECSDRFDRVDPILRATTPAMELAIERIEGADPQAEILFLHGILGRGANLRTLARRFVTACPGWSAVLVDLRGHGASKLSDARGGGVGEPATLAQCARDVAGVLGRSTRAVRAVLGHSFGGKVALALAHGGHDARVVRGRRFVVVDSLPGPRATARGSETTLEVLELLASLPGPFPTRQAFIAALNGAGLAQGIAEWLGTSLRKDDDGFRFGIDLGLVRALLDDYFTTDLWPVVAAPENDAHVHLVIGDRSTVFDDAAREHARALAADARGRVTLDVLPAGHWVHVDAPDALLDVLVRRVGPASSALADGGRAAR